VLAWADAAGGRGCGRVVFSFWGQIERGEKPLTTRTTVEAMADALRGHPVELTGQPWTPLDAADAQAQAGLSAAYTALERYQLGVDPQVPVRAWPQIQADLDQLVYLRHHVVDYVVQGELASVLIGELHSAYVRLPQRRRKGLIDAYRVTIMTTKDLGDRGVPAVAARAVQHCAEMLDDAVWLGCAAVVRGYATGELDQARGIPPPGGDGGDPDEQAGLGRRAAGLRDAAPAGRRGSRCTR
jgi:hypothetical protein